MSDKEGKTSKAKRCKSSSVLNGSLRADGCAVIAIHVTDGNEALMEKYVSMCHKQNLSDFPDNDAAMNEEAFLRGKELVKNNWPLPVPTIGCDSIDGRDGCEWVMKYGARSGCLAAKEHFAMDDECRYDYEGLRAVIVRVYTCPAVNDVDTYASCSVLVGHVLCTYYSLAC